MAKYVITRLLWLFPVVLGVLIIVFTISYLTPGDPVLMQLPNDYTQEDYDVKAHQMGLDKGYVGQLFDVIWKLVTRMDLGTSYLTNFPISYELAKRIPISFRLSLMCMLLMVIIGIPLGISSALNQYSAYDFGLTSLSLFLAAIPSYVLALLAALFFGVMLRWLPVTGIDSWKSWILPVICTAGMGIAVYTRMARTTMLEIIRQDYIRTARAKGLSENTIITRHALKNCLIILVTSMGAQVARLFSGSIVVETIFAIPGVGTYMMNGITSRDYPIVTGSVFVLSTLVCCVNLAVDIVYAFIDPRIKAQFLSKSEKSKLLKKTLQEGEKA